MKDWIEGMFALGLLLLGMLIPIACALVPLFLVVALIKYVFF